MKPLLCPLWSRVIIAFVPRLTFVIIEYSVRNVVPRPRQPRVLRTCPCEKMATKRNLPWSLRSDTKPVDELDSDTTPTPEDSSDDEDSEGIGSYLGEREVVDVNDFHSEGETDASDEEETTPQRPPSGKVCCFTACQVIAWAQWCTKPKLHSYSADKQHVARYNLDFYSYISVCLSILSCPSCTQKLHLAKCAPCLAPADYFRHM